MTLICFSFQQICCQAKACQSDLNVTVWLNANKISLNVDKTDLVIFKHQRKKLDTEILNLLDILVLRLNKISIGKVTSMILQLN